MEVARANFSTVRKGGVDPTEVRLHLEAVAREMGHLETRVRELQDQLNAANRRAENPVLDESELASRLGAQSANILRAAHDEATRIVSEAQERATRLFADSQSRAAEHLMEAEDRAATIVREAETVAAAIELESREAAERLIESAKTNAESLIEHAREQGRAIVEQANDARRTMLNDLAVKRKALMMQIEQLRAARDSLGSFIQTARDQIDGVVASAHQSDEAAKAAALEALRLRPATPEPTEAELIGNTPMREVPAVQLTVIEGGPQVRSPRRAKNKVDDPPAPPIEEPVVEDDPAATDVVNDIFARLRAATLEERGHQVPVKPEPAVAPLVGGDEIFERRHEALASSLEVLLRRVKRALQDDQNVMLERLRNVQGIITTEMEDEHAQRSRYSEAAIETLFEIAETGALFASQESGATVGSVDPELIHECAADLAVTISLALRKRILADGAGNGGDRVDAAFREWRGARIERLCNDMALRAFHVGVLATGVGRQVRFIVAPGESPCDACQLNGQGAPRPAGQTFPSGASYPPVHAGCACTIAVL